MKADLCQCGWSLAQEGRHTPALPTQGDGGPCPSGERGFCKFQVELPSRRWYELAQPAEALSLEA